MSEETHRFETEKYEFYFYQGKDMREHAKNVIVNIGTVERREFTNEDVRELKEFFKDMGKWETFVKAGKSLLKDLGIKTKSEKEDEKEFGFEKYEMKFEKKYERVTVTIKLTPTESLRRTRGDTPHAVVPPLEEIVEQTKNVPKWKTLKKVISELKKHGILKG